MPGEGFGRDELREDGGVRMCAAYFGAEHVTLVGWGWGCGGGARAGEGVRRGTGLGGERLEGAARVTALVVSGRCADQVRVGRLAHSGAGVEGGQSS